MRIFVLIGIIVCCQAARADEFPRVTADLEAYDDRVASLEAGFAKLPADPHDRTWVKAKLKHMVEVDQYMREYSQVPFSHSYTDPERQNFYARFSERRWQALDARNTADLKVLLQIHGWISIGTFGEQADGDAWLLVQHADQDPAFQKSVLGILEPLVAKGETSAKNYAYLFDRVAARMGIPGEQKPQRYGTQGRCVGKGRWEPYEVEDPVNLDKRRASVGLMPEAEYQKMFVDLCHEDQSIH
jgi:hypothetical protein